jgi:tetratricopeptide (TPR) repeat protein
MTIQLPKELAQAKELLDHAKFEEALKIIENYEDVESLPLSDQLSALLIKANIFKFVFQFEEQVKISEQAYQISKILDLMPECVEALIGKAFIAVIGDHDKASSHVKEAEKIMNSLPNDSFKQTLRSDFLWIKSFIQFLKTNYNRAKELAKDCLKLTKKVKIGNKLYLAGIYMLLGRINSAQGKRTEALDYAMKSLECNKELNRAAAIAHDYTLIAQIYYTEGDLDQALQYCKKSLSISEIVKRSRLYVLGTLAQIYHYKGKVNRALKYQLQAVALSDELGMTDQLIMALISVGYYYRSIGRNVPAIESFERSLTLAEKWGITQKIAHSLMLLIWTYIDEKSREKADRYYIRLTDLYNQTKENGEIDLYGWYLLSKAYMMKSSSRLRDRIEAQALFKELINITVGEGLFINMGNLCDLLLEELSLNNDPEILDEITPLITKSLKMAEDAQNYYWLAETKLLQAKLALIKINIEEAKKLMVEAQDIAGLHDLDLLAWRISSEHDKLLEQIETWIRIEKEEAPISERIKLASTDDVLKRIQGKSFVEPIEATDEQSTVLLILAEGGVLLFSYPFTDEWKIDEDLFSSFLSAFSSFSTEFFSKGLDRVKFGDDMMLMESIGSFSFCYLFKGQTYLAKLKLSKFVTELQRNSSLWKSLEQHYRANQILEIKENSHFESLINEIFIG